MESYVYACEQLTLLILIPKLWNSCFWQWFLPSSGMYPTERQWAVLNCYEEMLPLAWQTEIKALLWIVHRWREAYALKKVVPGNENFTSFKNSCWWHIQTTNECAMCAVRLSNMHTSSVWVCHQKTVNTATVWRMTVLSLSFGEELLALSYNKQKYSAEITFGSPRDKFYLHNSNDKQFKSQLSLFFFFVLC